MSKPLDRPHIWAFGGGKGGVGKSVVAANVAVRLARRQQRVALIDVDLGGANLHTILGMPRPKGTLSDYITRRVESLDEVLAPSPIPNLSLASGARAHLEIANLKYTQKQRLLRDIAKLQTDMVLLDLGSGTHPNVLDFFLLADLGVLVVVPEPTSVENAYHFLKTALLRKIRRLKENSHVRSVVEAVVADPQQRRITSLRELIKRVRETDEEVGAVLHQVTSSFTPGIVINRATTPEQRRLGEEIAIVCQSYFEAEINFLGYIDSDMLVPRSIEERRPAVDLFPSSPFSRSIERLTRRLIATAEGRDA